MRQQEAPKKQEQEVQTRKISRTRACWDLSRVYHGCGDMDHGGEAVSVLSARMAIRLNSLSLQKKFSIRCRHLYISVSIGEGCARRGCWR